MSRPPWMFGGGRAADQAASSLLGVTVAIVAASAGRRSHGHQESPRVTYGSEERRVADPNSCS
jgi:hypothetical protein